MGSPHTFIESVPIVIMEKKREEWSGISVQVVVEQDKSNISVLIAMDQDP